MDKVWWHKVATASVVGAALLFLGLNLYRGWHGTRDYQGRIQPWLLLVSFIFTLAFCFLSAVGWSLTVRCAGGKVNLRRGMRIFFLSNLGKYLPGTVWYIAGRTYLGEREKIPAAVIATSVVVEMALALTSAALISSLALPTLLARYGSGGAYLGMAAVALSLTVLHPRPMGWLLNLFARLLHRLPSEVNLTVGYLEMARLLIAYIFIWAVGALAFLTLLYSIYPVPLAWLPTVAAIYAASWIVGFLTPFAPGGLGVREGALALLLGRYVPLPVATAAALLSRLWLTLGEAVWVAVAVRW